MKAINIATDSGTFPAVTPNSTMVGGGFYVSYNDHDIPAYGCDTTALVRGQMEKFYILNGDHRAMYSPLIAEGFDACLDYFKANIDAINKHSEKIEVAAGQINKRHTAGKSGT